MSDYTKIHAANAAVYEAITTASGYMEALALTGKLKKEAQYHLGGTCSDAYDLRRMYAKRILGNRINPGTKAAINGRFLEAWEQARTSQGLPLELGEYSGLAPRHVR